MWKNTEKVLASLEFRSNIIRINTPSLEAISDFLDSIEDDLTESELDMVTKALRKDYIAHLQHLINEAKFWKK